MEYDYVQTTSATPTSTPTPTPTNTSPPIIRWIQTNIITVVVLLLMVVMLFMMNGIGFPKDLIGDYVTRLIANRQELASQASSQLGAVAQL
jgi:hypothetical protein